MAYGLLAALSWGVAGFGAALAARRIGAFRTVVIGEAAALTGYVVLFLLGPFSLRGTGPVVWLLMLAGVIGLGGYLALYRGLESGHVGLVSAISARYAGVTVILSVLVLGERMTAAASSSAFPIIPLLGGLVLLHERIARWQAAGVVLILAGLVLLGAGS